MSVSLPRVGKVIKVRFGIFSAPVLSVANNAGPGGLLHFLGGKEGAGVGGRVEGGRGGGNSAGFLMELSLYTNATMTDQKELSAAASIDIDKDATDMGAVSIQASSSQATYLVTILA